MRNLLFAVCLVLLLATTSFAQCGPNGCRVGPSFGAGFQFNIGAHAPAHHDNHHESSHHYHHPHYHVVPMYHYPPPVCVPCYPPPCHRPHSHFGIHLRF